MTNTSCFNHLRRRSLLLAIASVVAAVTPALAQSSGNAAKPENDIGYSTIDLNAFVGAQWFQFGQGGTVRPLDFRVATVFGARLNEDFWKYVGIEEGLRASASTRRHFSRRFPLPINARALLGGRNYQFSLAALSSTLRRAVRAFRPYVTLGAVGVGYQPSSASAFKNVPLGTVLPVNNPGTKVEPGIMSGVGMRAMLNKSIALRVDLRSNWTLQPHFGLPNYPAMPAPARSTSPAHGTASALRSRENPLHPALSRAPAAPAPRSAAAATSAASASSGRHGFGDQRRA